MKILMPIIVLCTLYSCQSDNSLSKDTEVIKRRHFNIIIVPDLSNRLKAAGLIKDDAFIVQQFVSLIYPELITDDSKIYQEDVFRLDFINKLHMSKYRSETFSIDLARFKKEQDKRNKYLGIHEHSSAFQKDTAAFVSNLRNLIRGVKAERTYGSDIYGYLENLNDILIDTTTQDIYDAETKELLHNYHTNIIVLLTDGYIETSGTNDPHRSLSQTKIESFRKAYMLHGNNMALDSFLEQNRGVYAINPVRNGLLPYCRILVLQLCDRGQGLGANKHESLPDLKIIELLWKDWLIHSGIKRDYIGLYNCAATSDAQSTKAIFRKFLLKK